MLYTPPAKPVIRSVSVAAFLAVLVTAIIMISTGGLQPVKAAIGFVADLFTVYATWRVFAEDNRPTKHIQN